jgi:hypothetical protein
VEEKPFTASLHIFTEARYRKGWGPAALNTILFPN